MFMNNIGYQYCSDINYQAGNVVSVPQSVLAAFDSGSSLISMTVHVNIGNILFISNKLPV